MNSDSRLAAMIRSLILVTEYPFRASPNSSIRGTDCAGALPAPEIVGPPCATSPPTTKVALRDGGHLVAVGGQVARDEGGNVVGKGDLQAQIEQVGKNVGACLNGGGATVKDIIFSISHVTQ